MSEANARQAPSASEACRAANTFPAMIACALGARHSEELAVDILMPLGLDMLPIQIAVRF